MRADESTVTPTGPRPRACARRRRRSAIGIYRRGQSVIEFALLLPILLGLLLGTIDTAMMLSAKSDVAYADRQAARLMEAYGATPSINPDPAMLQALTDALRSSKADINGLRTVTFFKADTAAESQAGDNPANDLVYTYSNGALVGAPTGAYTYTLRSPGDHVGVTVTYRYSGFTPIFAGGFTFNDVTNVQIDPANGSFALPTPIPTPTNAPPSPQSTYIPVASPTPPWTYTPQATYTQPPTSTPTNTPTSTPTGTPTDTPTATPTPYVPSDAVASSDEITSTMPATNVIDGNLATRWGSYYASNPDPQWIYVDLGSDRTLSKVILHWERACGTNYQIQVAPASSDPNNPATWTTATTVFTRTGFTCGMSTPPYYPDDYQDSMTFSSVTGRYVRMYGSQRYAHPQQWGYSLWEFQVYP